MYVSVVNRLTNTAMPRSMSPNLSPADLIDLLISAATQSFAFPSPAILPNLIHLMAYLTSLCLGPPVNCSLFILQSGKILRQEMFGCLHLIQHIFVLLCTYYLAEHRVSDTASIPEPIVIGYTLSLHYSEALLGTIYSVSIEGHIE